MVKHVVMFKLIPFERAEEKLAKMEEIKVKLEGLMGRIEVLKAIRVDFNINPEETWDLILTTELPTLADVKTYAIHPEHAAISKEVIAPVKADRACVDYEF
ncbi:Dabb family protein [Parabacteroides sp. PF5-9]|uniref:Dabb family protein n=1 Tax=Parabacteroides sp. PF5-9 TaxID=1742404 RepID=UPI0024756836|nr:Dabb family protein [Parabacteroides sp. PF5-9]MDH6356587.1 hypothetical protein [Parabacteroides sp. PF5-9]